MNQINDLPSRVAIPLPELPGWEASAHWFEPREILAVQAALARGRPLLVRGEPGTGKTQLARAVAQQLGWVLISTVINGRSELEELFWHFDALDRLGEAQLLATVKETERLDRLEQRKFVTPGPLWWAFDWVSAQSQHDEHTRRKLGRPYWEGDTPPPGTVLLIDEIDKADLDLPNGLLEAFGQKSFRVPWVKEKDGTLRQSDRPLLTVITTNEERELPRAFLRRCFVLQLEYPDEKDEARFIDWLQARGRIHFPELARDSKPAGKAKTVLEEAAEMIRVDRLGTTYGAIRPGLAEYLDLLGVVTSLHPDDQTAQLANLVEVGQFVRTKQGRSA